MLVLLSFHQHMECNELFSDNFFMKLEHDHEILLDFVLVYHSLHDIAQCFEKQDNSLRREDLHPLFALSTLTVYKLCDENEDIHNMTTLILFR